VDTPTKVRQTSNGWAVATPTAINPQDQGDGVIIFRQSGGIRTVADYGSGFSNDPAVPQDV
jgi:hypothetical protein